MTLLKAMGVSDTSLILAGPSTFPGIGGLIQIGSEQIIYTMSSDDALIGLTRGANGTTAATHAAGVTVTLLEGVAVTPAVDPRPLPLIPYRVGSTFIEADNGGTLTDPTSITQSMIDSNTVIYVFAHTGNVAVTLPTPTVPSVSRKLIVLAGTDASHTVTVNTIGITVGSGQLFVWSATAQAWFAC